jgi:phage terminase small subunit
MTTITPFPSLPAVGPAEPPEHLGEPAAEMWRSIQMDYDVSDGAGLALLRVACEMFDRAEAARRILERDGLVIADGRRAHPAFGIERDARQTMIRSLKALGLDIIPSRGVLGRPAGKVPS